MTHIRNNINKIVLSLDNIHKNEPCLVEVCYGLVRIDGEMKSRSNLTSGNRIIVAESLVLFEAARLIA